MSTPDKLHTPEEKFFGITHTVEKPVVEPESVEKLEVEVVDDRPPEDQRPPKKAEKPKVDAKSEDEELEGYSEKVKKRINKLRYDQHEERRRADSAERMRDEAVNHARRLSKDNEAQRQLLAKGEAQLVKKFTDAADSAITGARAKYKAAYEAGDTDTIISTQEELIAAQAQLKEATDYNADYTARKEEHDRFMQARAQQPPPQPVYQPQQPQPVQRPAAPNPKAASWAEDNKWFGSAEHTDMTALAYGVHEDLIKNKGYDPESDEYFQAIDDAMRTRFPEQFNEEEPGSGRQPVSTPRKPSVVVTPSTRNNGAKTRKVKLTSTQIALAPRLGLTADQYARQLIKEME